MGPRKPEIEYINLKLVAQCNPKVTLDHVNDDQTMVEALNNVKKLANGALKKGPYSITKNKKPPHIAASGDIHDFISYAPYWWPSDDGTYIRKDGKRNPDVSLLQDQTQLEEFAENLMYLCIGYQIYKKEEYANHAIHLLDVFFVDPCTKMNPNVNYGQVIRGSNHSPGGRPDGIISTRMLARVANVIPVLMNYPGYRRIADSITKWFQDYAQWLLTSDLGRKAAALYNNHASWYMVQLIMVSSTFGSSSLPFIDTLHSFIHTTLPRQIDMETGNQPLESQRTRPFHYLVFNLQALIYIRLWLHQQGNNLGCQHVDDYLTKAVDYLISYDTTHEDPTEAVRCVQQQTILCRDDKDTVEKEKYRRFIDMAMSCDKADRISGPKNTIYWTWSR
ncbi:alginate lyase-domain-containing protein [Chlamydoabsidia padenii]|nr:alginate lyase-domain-containing protein [Chlamydoabsidia padenii]